MPRIRIFEVGRVFLREFLLQLDQLAVRSAGLVISGMAFFGAVLITIANVQARTSDPP